MDLATIGFSADTSGLDKASTSLQKLVPASAAAANAADNVTASLQGTSAAATAVANAAKGTTTQTSATSKVIAAATGTINQQTTAHKNVAAAANGAAAANDNLAHSHAGLSTQAMAAQHSIRSMVEALASGMPVSQVLSQQLNHLSYAASGPGGITGAFSEAFGSITKLISGWALVGAGVTGVVAAFAAVIYQVSQSELALSNLSKQTDITMQDLHGLLQAASLKGISTDEFTKAITAFSSGVSDAQHNMGALNSLMIANGQQAKDLQGYFMNVARLVSQTASGVQQRNILEAAGLPTTIEWLNLMKQGPDAIKAIIAGSVQFGANADENMVKKAQEFQDSWNKASTFFVNGFKSAIVSVAGGLQTLIDLHSKLNIAAATSPVNLALTPSQQFSQRFSAANDNPAANNQPLQKGLQKAAAGLSGTPAPNSKPLTPEQAQHNIQVQQQQISMLGDLASVTDQVKSKQLEFNSAALNGVSISSQMQKHILLGVQAQAEQNRVNQQATSGIFDLNAAQKAASDTLQHWIDQKILDPTNTQQMAAAQLVLSRNIKATADAAAVAAAPLQGLKQLELDGSNLAKSLDTATTSALNNLVQPIQDMMNGVTGLSAGFKNLGVVVLQAIQQMIIKMLIITPIARALQAVMGGIFGFSSGGVPGAIGLSSLGGAPLVANAFGGVYNSPSLSAYSGQIVTQPTLFKFASGSGLMGEAGPEGILPLKRGPSGALGVQMYGGNQSSNDNSATNFHYSPQNVYNIGGNVTQADLDAVKKSQENDRQQFSSNVVGTIKNMRKHNVRV